MTTENRASSMRLGDIGIVVGASATNQVVSRDFAINGGSRNQGSRNDS